MKITKDIIKSGTYGCAIGDALGLPFQFMNREEMELNPCIDMVGYGTYNKKPGTFSDDTSMTLATMEAFLESNDSNLLENIMDNFASWLRSGKYTVDGAFDEGTTCYKAICNYLSGKKVNECGCKGFYDNGNGALMRILPASLYLINSLKEETTILDYSLVEKISSLTHAHPISVVGCSIYTSFIFNVIKKKDVKKEFVNIVEDVLFYYKQTGDNNFISACEKYNRLTQNDFITLSENQIIGSGYVVESLEAALYCFLTTNNFKDCLLKAVNLGEDTDTVGSIVGGIAGIYYGYDSIPLNWIKTLRGVELIDKAISSFTKSL